MNKHWVAPKTPKLGLRLRQPTYVSRAWCIFESYVAALEFDRFLCQNHVGFGSNLIWGTQAQDGSQPLVANIQKIDPYHKHLTLEQTMRLHFWMWRRALCCLRATMIIVLSLKWGVHRTGDTDEHHTPRSGWRFFPGDGGHGQATWLAFTLKGTNIWLEWLEWLPLITCTITKCRISVWFSGLFFFRIFFACTVPSCAYWQGLMCCLALWAPSMFDKRGRDLRRTRQHWHGKQEWCKEGLMNRNIYQDLPSQIENNRNIMKYLPGSTISCFCIHLQLTTAQGAVFSTAVCCGVCGRIWSKESSSTTLALMQWIKLFAHIC